MMRIPRRTAWITLIVCLAIALAAGIEWYRHGFAALFDGPRTVRNARSFSFFLWALVAAALGGFMIVALLFGKRVPSAKPENEQPQGPDPTHFGTWL